MKLTVVIQYHGHVIHAGGCTTYRTVVLELTEEQTKQLALKQDEDYGPVEFVALPEKCNRPSIMAHEK